MKRGKKGEGGRGEKRVCKRLKRSGRRGGERVGGRDEDMRGRKIMQ